MNYWFTADLHLGHLNIIKYCNRPFRSVEDMDYALIQRWNARVKLEDTIFVIGDFCFRSIWRCKTKPEEYIKQLNGNKVFIRGNHDKNNSTKTIIESLQIKYGGNYIHLVHDPSLANSIYQFNFVGHIHNHWKFKQEKIGLYTTNLINVGVDVWDFFPVTINEIMQTFSKWIKQEKK